MDRTDQTAAVRLGAWQYDAEPSFDAYKAPIGSGWNNYEGRWHEPPAVEVSIADGVSIEHAIELLKQLVSRAHGMLEAEAEHAARKVAAEKRFTRLTDVMRDLSPERLQLVESLIRQLSGRRAADDCDIDF